MTFGVLSDSEVDTMADIAHSRDAVVVDIKKLERLWNDAILRRDVDSAASFLAPEYKLVIGSSVNLCR